MPSTGPDLPLISSAGRHIILFTSASISVTLANYHISRRQRGVTPDLHFFLFLIFYSIFNLWNTLRKANHACRAKLMHPTMDQPGVAT